MTSLSCSLHKINAYLHLSQQQALGQALQLLWSSDDQKGQGVSKSESGTKKPPSGITRPWENWAIYAFAGE
jgi:hypothetical protein